MRDPFASAKSVLRRADKHIADLETALQCFTADKPYVYVIEKHEDGVRDVHKLRFSADFSDDIACIMFDAVGNLRAALDQIAYAVATANGSTTLQFAYFPFASDAAHLINRVKGLKDIPPAVRSLFESFKPYKGGDDTLWSLNYISNIKKHALLVPVSFGQAVISTAKSGIPGLRRSKSAAGQRGIAIEGQEVGWSVRGDVSNENPSWNPATNEIILLVTGPGPKPDVETDFTYTIVIRHKEKIIDGQHPTRLLNAMRGRVERVLAATEAACRRIGLLT